VGNKSLFFTNYNIKFVNRKILFLKSVGGNAVTYLEGSIKI